MTIETGLWDCHKITVSVLKIYFAKKDPTTLRYRCFKHINEQEFKNDLCLGLQTSCNTPISYDEFRKMFMKAVDKYAPIKTKKVRGNHPNIYEQKII